MRADVLILVARFLTRLFFISLFLIVLVAGVYAIDYFKIYGSIQGVYAFGLAIVLSFVALAAKRVDDNIKAL